MTGMIERMAVALSEVDPDGWDDQMNYFRAQAAVALKAMREPTGAMIDAECQVIMGELGGIHDSAYWEKGWPQEIWQAMIDAALKGS